MIGDAFMKKTAKSADYLHDSPLHALGTVCLPLILVNVVLMFTTTLTNTLYSRYAGQTYFTVTGYLSVASTLYINMISSVYLAGWVKIAHQFSLQDKQKVTRSMQSVLLTMTLAAGGLSLLFVLFTKPVLHALNIPSGLYADARLYYCLYLLCYLPSALAAFFLTTSNGISGAGRIFWINIMVIVTNLLGAWLLMAVLQMKLIGAALCGALSAAMQLAVYLCLFRRDGFLRSGVRFSPDWRLMGAVLRCSVPIALQNLLCTVGYLLVTLQTNRLLKPEYITVLNVSLPLTGVMSAVGSAILAFCPQNYGAGKAERLRRFLRLAIGCSVIYGIICFLIYALLGSRYYGWLFTDSQIVELGSRYWFWQGVGYLFLAVLYPIRYFFDSVGKSQLSMLSGLGELIGNAVCAFWLIPVYGNIGRSLSYPLGWAVAACFLVCAYLCRRRQIFRSCESQCKIEK